jgi:methylenetetrahydrofolate dehydrogenase (NADP+) / methenyltetrahydrofolate cyclohydrolase
VDCIGIGCADCARTVGFRPALQSSWLADILVVAAGVPNLIVAQIVRTRAVVIEVGINRLPDGRIVGDVDFAGVSEKTSPNSPVSVGVGPLTVTMRLYNTLRAAERAAGMQTDEQGPG